MSDEPDPIAAVERDLGALGIEGERETRLLIYLAGTSRLAEDPLGLIIQGASSSGKNALVDPICECFPESDVVKATTMSPQALYYGEADWLKHKFVVQGERSHRDDSEQADKTAALRQLFSEKKIIKRVVTTETGRGKTETIVQTGPISYVETTTSRSIFREDLNRMLLLRTDAGSETTRKVLLAKAGRRMAGAPMIDVSAVEQRHREFQGSLQPMRVVIPYARAIAEHFPVDKPEARRAIDKVFSTIEAIALLWQFQRRADGRNRLRATVDDYRLARRLLQSPLQLALGLGEDWETARQLRETFPESFDANQALGSNLFSNKMARDRTLKRMAGLGILRLLKKGKSHQPTVWQWNGNPPDELVLPRVKTIFGGLRNTVKTPEKGCYERKPRKT